MKKGNDKSIMFNTHLDSRPALYSLLTLVKCENCSMHQKFTNEIVLKFVGANLFMKMKQKLLTWGPGGPGGPGIWE